jgi:hypothetical protein
VSSELRASRNNFRKLMLLSKQPRESRALSEVAAGIDEKVLN